MKRINPHLSRTPSVLHKLIHIWTVIDLSTNQRPDVGNWKTKKAKKNNVTLLTNNLNTIESMTKDIVQLLTN